MRSWFLLEPTGNLPIRLPDARRCRFGQTRNVPQVRDVLKTGRQFDRRAQRGETSVRRWIGGRGGGGGGGPAPKKYRGGTRTGGERPSPPNFLRATHFPPLL